jgi:hypothetical protein
LARVDEALTQLPAIQAIDDRQPRRKTPHGGARVDHRPGRARHEGPMGATDPPIETISPPMWTVAS